jgi:hypothetical protein
MNDNEKLKELKQKLDEFTKELVAEYKIKIESLTNVNGTTSFDNFKRNKLEIYNLISEYYKKYVASQEYKDMHKEELELAINQFTIIN